MVWKNNNIVLNVFQQVSMYASTWYVPKRDDKEKDKVKDFKKVQETITNSTITTYISTSKMQRTHYQYGEINEVTKSYYQTINVSGFFVVPREIISHDILKEGKYRPSLSRKAPFPEGSVMANKTGELNEIAKNRELQTTLQERLKGLAIDIAKEKLKQLGYKEIYVSFEKSANALFIYLPIKKYSSKHLKNCVKIEKNLQKELPLLNVEVLPLLEEEEFIGENMELHKL